MLRSYFAAQSASFRRIVHPQPDVRTQARRAWSFLASYRRLVLSVPALSLTMSVSTGPSTGSTRGTPCLRPWHGPKVEPHPSLSRQRCFGPPLGQVTGRPGNDRHWPGPVNSCCRTSGCFWPRRPRVSGRYDRSRHNLDRFNAVTYLDMVLRGRPASSTPQQTVEKLSQLTHLPVPGDAETRSNQVSGLGPLTGIGPGVPSLHSQRGVATAAARRGRACVRAGTSGIQRPMTALGMTDPPSWSVAWVSDLVPHLAYGALTAAVLRRLLPSRPSGPCP